MIGNHLKCKINTYFVTNPDKKNGPLRRLRTSGAPVEIYSNLKKIYFETFPQHISSVSQQEADAGSDAGSHS